MKKAETMTPVKSRETIGDSDREEIDRTRRTATMAKRNAETWGGNAGPRKTRESEAPKPAPEESPRMYSLTRGFLKRACRAAPETDKAAPTVKARMRRGRRTPKTMAAYPSGRAAFQAGTRGERSVLNNPESGIR